MYLSTYLFSYISNDIVYMYVLLYLIFTFVRFARGNKIMKKFAHVKEKYILQFIHWIYYNV